MVFLMGRDGRIIRAEAPGWLLSVDWGDVLLTAESERLRLVGEGRMKPGEKDVVFPYTHGERKLLVHVDLEKRLAVRVDVLAPSGSAVEEIWLVHDLSASSGRDHR